ncbi:MAG: MFS transporter [Spirochaetes bacterium]|uniref:MFS transporter n=1 Tax=Candidatus Ornithospirochaeta stercoripullorum TaxID=2840899 RepID=A0A9D9E1A5_9SPIO|nr:MFS transporter [Candidatus Ornithospirochaeta stercoripullorum]
MFSLFLLIVIYLAFISLGLPDSMLGAAWPVMYQDLGVPVSWAGYISVTICLGTTVSSLIYAKLTDKFSTWCVTTVSIALTALALFGFSIAPSFPLLILAAIVLGIGAGAVDAGLNNFVALHYKARAMNFLHAFWGVGTLVGPFLLSFLFAKGLSWRNGYTTISTAQAAICIIVLLSRALWKKAGDSSITQDRKKPEIKSGENASLRSAISKPGAKAAMLGFFSYCSVEQTSMLWASTYMVSVKGASESYGALYAGILFWGITAGRIVSGLIANKINGRLLIRIAQSLILIGLLSVLLAPTAAAPIALFFLGFGFGPIYPTMLHQTPEFFGSELSARIMGLEMSSAYIGSAFMPALFGIIGRNITMALFPFYALMLLLLNAGATEYKIAIAKRTGR